MLVQENGVHLEKRGHDVLAARASILGPVTGKGGDDMALASIYDAARPPSTIRAYQLGQRTFAEWCGANQIPYAFPAHAVTPEALALFISELASQGRKPATIENYLAGVAAMHRAIDIPSPTDSALVRNAKRAMRQSKGTRQAQAAPVRRTAIDTALARMGSDLIELRDAALISLAYDTGARADNLVAFNHGDLELSDGVASIRIGKAKTDQEGKGRVVPVLPDTLARLQVWIEAGGLDREGKAAPLFYPLSKKGMGARLARRDVARIFSTRICPEASAHSIRVGAAQDMRAAGFSNSDIAHAFGWKGDAMPARYTAHLDAQDSAAVKLARLQGRA
jgi:integrase